MWRLGLPQKDYTVRYYNKVFTGRPKRENDPERHTCPGRTFMPERAVRPL